MSLIFNDNLIIKYISNMYMRYYLNKEGKRIYSLQVNKKLLQFKNEKGEFTLSAHPARFSPDDKFSHERILCKKRYGLLPTKQPDLKLQVNIINYN